MKARIVTLLIVLLRSFLLGKFIWNNSVYALPIALSEGFALWSTLRGMEREKCYDTEWYSVLVPALYLSPLLFQHATWATPFPLAIFWVIGLGIGQLILRIYMGWHVTVGLPMFRSLLAKGPYGYVRHPLAATEIAIAILFPLAFPSLWNIAWSVVCVSGFVVAVLIEERFLCRFSEYRFYRCMVPYFFIPRVL